ncbi:UDP-N-acetylmuramoyl-L-alanyl-D-glutamate--2,6-diaminopimelate ligase [Piscibacillus halophilus]|uniref:UDP-N-acetylmuramoyl-L-alanyl-D-glutamate--2,6-diaminopimelate ligase n=1 Tax=Piscibacillus halophilus TaxID=571933 RepID=A0A1H8YSN8_9BACI|nr:UDP-N-acetylmuramoyl-L-alanyl-D-glutamate--2,6-diaminopimelate ligase [Piscibacillus halophilus]SEP55190.1 UDP-N-acetylmuramoylalanyl-D-glutamate--2,6-diaminopimelate ligase [Piscibacillus halophilus]
MHLHELVESLNIYKTDADERLENVDVKNIEMDSRKVENNSLFVCIKGTQVDGHQFVKDAEENGACAIVAEDTVDTTLPVIYVPSTVKALAVLADRFYGTPSKSLNIVGITGTNGKTTTTYLLDGIFKENNQNTAIIGTIDMKIGDKTYPLNNTTPDSLFLHKHLHLMKEQGVDTVIMEASSHALHQGRVHGVQFDTVVFTNLTQDHLDYHLNMNDYAYAKSLLFAQLGNDYTQNKIAVINADDHYSEVMSKASPFPFIPYGLTDDAYIKAKNLDLQADSTSFEVLTPNEQFKVESRLTGKFNIYNILAAISVAYQYRISSEIIQKALRNINGVPGRLENVDVGQPYSVIVDYAHTPDSLENVLQTLNEIKENRIITVVGCGGDRDRSKRPKMADASIKYSQLSLFTSDNPRTEDPKHILKDMTGHLKGDEFKVIIDRKEAIKEAIWTAKEGDIILIAGKGHETYQEVNGARHHFDDREIAKTYIEERMKESQST